MISFLLLNLTVSVYMRVTFGALLGNMFYGVTVLEGEAKVYVYLICAGNITKVVVVKNVL
jgi:hypothetical protein